MRQFCDEDVTAHLEKKDFGCMQGTASHSKIIITKLTY